jgi:hypothetical protein
MTNYKSQTARDAQTANYGDRSYWDKLEANAHEYAAYYTKKGLHDLAARMLTRTLGEALAGNDGE